MKKRLTAIISSLLSVLLSVSIFSGCNLVTTDTEKDMAQVIATVSINQSLSDEIYKSDLAIAYMSSGGYSSDSGVTVEEFFDDLVNTLLSQRIVVQSALLDLENDATFVKDESVAKFQPQRYLTSQQKIEAEYTAFKSVNNLIGAFKDSEDAKQQDTLVEEVRTAPLNASNAEADVDKNAYVQKGIDVSDRKAFNKFVNYLEVNGLVGATYRKTTKAVDLEYVQTLLTSAYEDQVISIYEKRLSSKAKAQITYEVIESKYQALFSEQSQWNNKEFVEKLDSATADSPLLYSAYDNYGYVYNLLLGVSDYQKEQIESIRTDNPNVSDDEYAQKRSEILKDTVVRDQRSTWVLANYDNQVENGILTFTGDYTFTTAKNSLSFKGAVKEIAPANEEEKTKAQYTVTDLTPYSLTDFVKLLEEYLGGTASAPEKADFTTLGASLYQPATILTGVEEYQEKINELIFAFSTDAGSLSSYKGYVIKPEVDGSNSETYVKTFGDAGRLLLKEGKDGYAIVASDYGYHVMFYSSVNKPADNCDTLAKYLKSLGVIDGIDDQEIEANAKAYLENMLDDFEDYENVDEFLYTFVQNQVETLVSEYQDGVLRELQNTHMFGDNKSVTVYKDRYANLLG